MATALERENLEAHVDLCEQRYKNLEGRLDKIEKKVPHIHEDITRGPTKHDQSYYRCKRNYCRWLVINYRSYTTKPFLNINTI